MSFVRQNSVKQVTLIIHHAMHYTFKDVIVSALAPVVTEFNWFIFCVNVIFHVFILTLQCWSSQMRPQLNNRCDQ